MDEHMEMPYNSNNLLPKKPQYRTAKRVSALVGALAAVYALAGDLGTTRKEVGPYPIPFATIGPTEIYKVRTSPFLTETFVDYGGNGTLDSYALGIRFLPGVELQRWDIMPENAVMDKAVDVENHRVKKDTPLAISLEARWKEAVSAPVLVSDSRADRL